MRDIKTISQEDFRACLPRLSFATLKKLIEGIAEMTQGNIPDPILHDLLRKETKIWSELQRRGFIGKHNRQKLKEFFQWRWNGLKYKRKLY